MGFLRFFFTESKRLLFHDEGGWLGAVIAGVAGLAAIWLGGKAQKSAAERQRAAIAAQKKADKEAAEKAAKEAALQRQHELDLAAQLEAALATQAAEKEKERIKKEETNLKAVNAPEQVGSMQYPYVKVTEEKEIDYTKYIPFVLIASLYFFRKKIGKLI